MITKNNKRQALIDLMKDMPLDILSIAYLYAKNFILYGEDITEKWLTATQNASALEKAYMKGQYDALQSLLAESEDKNDKISIRYINSNI